MLRNLTKYVGIAALSGALAIAVLPTKQAAAQSAILGQLMLFSGNFCPRGWSNADGQLIPIPQNTALFSIFGTMYGGDGRTTFALPDLRNRSIVSQGNGPGIGSGGQQGARSGTVSVTLTQSQLPPHTHTAYAAQATADNQNPTGDLLGGSLSFVNTSSAGTVPFSNAMIGQAGSSASFNKRSPMQVLRYCVALQGVYPSRN